VLPQALSLVPLTLLSLVPLLRHEPLLLLPRGPAHYLQAWLPQAPDEAPLPLPPLMHGLLQQQQQLLLGSKLTGLLLLVPMAPLLQRQRLVPCLLQRLHRCCCCCR
jgi:hypothetical protein